MDRPRSRAKAEPDAPPPADPVDPRALGARLRAMFRAVEQAPVPDEMTRLVGELEKKRTRRNPRRN